MAEIQSSNNLEERKRIWSALSTIYLEGQLDDLDVREIARVIRHSSFTLDEVMDIDKYEVYPALRKLFLNTDSIRASGIDIPSLEERIMARRTTSKVGKWWLEVSYVFYCTFYQQHWRRIKKALKD